MRRDNFTNEPKREDWYRHPLNWLLTSDPGSLVLYAGLFLGFLTFITWGENPHDISLWIKIASLFVLTSIFMSMAYGSPMNWWRPFFGHDVVIDATTAVTHQMAPENKEWKASEETCNEVLDAWLKESGIKRVVRINYRRYRFLYKKDAMRFKLSWWRV